MRDNLFLIDSTFFLESTEASFRGAPLLADPEGRDHTLAFGVARDILKLRKKLGIHRAAIIVGRESVAATSEDVLADLLSLWAQLKITVLRDDGARVVDICARYAGEARWIVSANWALSQLVTADLGLFIPAEGGALDSVTAESLSSLGIRPDQVPSLLALTENNEAPLKRPQAIRLLELYGTLDAALADASSAPSVDWKRKLAPRKDALLQRMAEIQVRPGTQVRQPQNLNGAFIDHSKESAEALQRYGFWSLIRLLPLPAATDCAARACVERETEYRAIRNAADLRDLEQCLLNVEVCAIDTETTGKDPRTATLLGIALSVREAQAFFVPMLKPDLDGVSPDEVHTRLKKLLTRKIHLIGHNLKYDLAVLRRHGIEVHSPHFDTMLAAYDCFGDWEFWNLAAVAKKLLGSSIKRYRDIVNAGETFLDKPFKELVEHGCSDADMAFRLFGVLLRELKIREIEGSFFGETMRVEEFLMEREHRGIRVDKRRLANVRDAAEKNVSVLRTAALATAGSEFDVDSPKAAADALRKLGIWEKTARQPANSQLEQLAPDYPLAAQIVEYRRERKRYRELESICSAEENGRVYPSFSQMRTPHGCLSSDAPRLDEAIAAGAVLDEELLDLFGNSKAGLESLRDATGDSALRGDLSKRLDGGDFVPGPWAVTGVPHGEMLLAIVSGETDHAICGRFLIKKEHAAAIRNRLVLRYKSVFAWLDEFKRAALTQGFVEHRGKRKYLAGLSSSDIAKRGKAVTAAIRWLVRY